MRSLGLFVGIATLSLAHAADAADMAVKAPLTPLVTAPSWELFGGVTIAPDSFYGEVGAVFAFNRNLTVDGWLFRLKGGAGSYDYNRAPGLHQDADFQTGEFMIGYQTFVGSTRFSGYVGPNVEHHDNPDPLATVKGTEWGIKGQGEVFMPMSDRWYVFALANVAPGISVGPELSFLGNDRFDAVRLGPFVAIDMGPGAQLILSAGYSWDTNSDALNDHSGGYFTAHARKVF
jgi:hypothetical protein